MFAGKIKSLGAILTGLCLVVSAHAAPKRYIVQFKSAAAFYAMSQNFATFNNPSNGVQANQVHLFSNSTAVTQTLPNLQLLVVESEDALAIQSLKSNPAIALVEEEFFHPGPEPIATRSPADASGDMNAYRRGSNPTTGGMDMPWGISAVKAPQAWTVTRGRGARVMILDTGIDQGHPALVGQIEAVQNFTGGAKDDVTDQVGHGSHVSGTILANGANGGLVGVAPEAKVLMGKVCSDQGCSNVAIVEGLDWAASEKVDVVNMSLGGALLSPGEATALQAAEAAGVMVVAASGNDGKPTVSFPGAAPTVLAIGAIDINLVKAEFSNWGPELGVVGPGVDVISSVPRGTGRGAAIQIDLDGKGLNDIKSLPFVGSPVAAAATNNLVFANLGKPEDFTGINVRGKFALISRGDIPFKDKVTNAIAAGAIGVLIFNNATGLMQGAVSADGSEVSIPCVMIEQSIGLAAKAALSSGKAINASLAVVRTDYASFQGTSMATPHVTGVAALVRAANKNLTPAQVRALLKATATPLSPNDQNQLGAGVVNADAAVRKANLDLPLMQIAN